MPSPSPGKYRGPVVRQLSLQNPTPLQSSVSRGLKKQFSEDDSKGFDSVEVTGQKWSAGISRTELRVGSGNGKLGQTKVVGARPKPVKVAWADRKPESPEGVEVIAIKCQGQPRPSSLKTQRLQSPLLGNKDTLVYTRLQLAERLRNAWSEREKMKPNVNIFLARAPDTTRSENEVTTDRPTSAAALQDTASALSDPSAPLDKKRKSMRVRAFSQELPHPDLYDLKHPENYIPSEPALSPNENEGDSKEINKISPREEEKEFNSRHLQELNKIEIRMTKIESGTKGRENKPPEMHLEEPSDDMRQCRNKTPESSSGRKSDTESKDVVESSPVTAQDRRANFRRSSILQKTIIESFSSVLEENENKTVAKPSQKKLPLIRAFSAPSQNTQPSDAHKAANLQKKVRIISQRRLQPAVSFDIPSSNNDDVTALKDRIKSAPVRRRLKSAAARRKNKDKDSSDEEKETKDSAGSTKKISRRNQSKKGSEIVTMVSLVSPAASDTEDSVINLPMESWREEDKEELSQGMKSSGNVEESKESTFTVQKFVSLRKATKSVTFHPNPVLSRSYSASFPSRRVPAGTPIVVPTPVISNPALTPAQLLERDKNTPVFSAVSSGLDGRGVKRKLIRSSIESTKDDDVLDGDEKDSKTDAKGISENIEKSKQTNDEGEEKANGDPDFKCPKERECWNLYQKMIEKGVCVSFDTVLRGMLTPTEYRLRKNHLLSNC